jgi:lysophospholipase L1-like esterase
MSATNGSTLSLRKRGRLVGLALAIVFALSALFASTAGAVPPIKETYLALGDSLAFGYSTQTFNQQFPTESPSAFERGYAHFYFNHLKPTLEGVQQTNKGCPGETTDSMIGNGALAGAFGIPGESPCAYHKAGFPLHSEYGGKSQLESAMEALAVDSFTGKPVTHLTLNIGANDELKAIAKCEAEVKEELETSGKSKYWSEEGPFTPEAAVQNCIVAHVPSLFEHIIQNTGRILTAVREGSKFGGVNYGGPINFVGNYDPYGNVCGPTKGKNNMPIEAAGPLPVPTATCRAAFKMKEGQYELLEGSRTLAALLTGQIKTHLAGPFAMCVSDAQPLFNPANRYEPKDLQTNTNMVNFSESNGKKNGPDIHPTEMGYKKLNVVMVKTCG